jgi:hypothetical protein
MRHFSRCERTQHEITMTGSGSELTFLIRYRQTNSRLFDPGVQGAKTVVSVRFTGRSRFSDLA